MKDLMFEMDSVTEALSAIWRLLHRMAAEEGEGLVTDGLATCGQRIV